MLSGFFQNKSSTSGTLPSNNIPNPKGEMKAITTRSGVVYEGPSIPTPKTTLLKPNIPYPSSLNDQNLHEKATNQIEKFFQIFQDLHFDISFADALLLMPKFDSTIKSLLTNKDKLFELAKIPLNENCSAMLLEKLLEKLGDKFLLPYDFLGMDMTLELADRSITRPIGVTEDVFVKVGKFHFSTDFVVVDFEGDPRVPLILERSFLRTGRALIDVYGEKIILRVNDEAVSFNLIHTTRYFSTYDDLSIIKIDIIDVAREEHKILMEEDYKPAVQSQRRVNPKIHEVINKEVIKLLDVGMIYPISDSPWDISKVYDGDFYDMIEKTMKVFMDDFLVFGDSFSSHKISKNELEVDRAKVDVIAQLPHPTTVKGVRSFLEHAGFYRRFIQDFSKIARPMTHLLEKETPFVFSKDFIDAFETLKKKLTESSILFVPD
nr:reverse transcriptase domain-containing protein [Tanacetum cinerariifolium]GEZ37215.1 reverse transcriptase domain-containing protein [Tanacetum cinerariifolium]